MDGDPAVDSQLDTFSLYFPLPYRIAIILVLGTENSCACPVVTLATNWAARRLGLGSESSLFSSIEHRILDLPQSTECMTKNASGPSNTHQISHQSIPSGCAGTSANLQTRDNYYHTANCLDPSLLAHNSWLTNAGSYLGYPPAVLPLLARRPLSHPLSASFAHGSILVSLYLEAHQYWTHSRGPGWKIWRHPSCGCADLICQGAG